MNEHGGEHRIEKESEGDGGLKGKEGGKVTVLVAGEGVKGQTPQCQ